MNFLSLKRLHALILLYGAGTMVAQVLILRELLVLAQGQELKLALGLWCWLLWVGLGSLAGGRFTPAGAGPGRLGGLLALLGLLLPATILTGRALPTLARLPLGQSLPLSTTFGLFFVLLAPFGLVSGYFFPSAVQVLADTFAHLNGGTGVPPVPRRLNLLEPQGFHPQGMENPPRPPSFKEGRLKSPFGKGGFRRIWFFTIKPASTKNGSLTENRYDSNKNPQGNTGRVYYLETLGAALGVALLQLIFIGRFANLSLGLAVGFLLALAPWLLAQPKSLAARAVIALNLLVLTAALASAPRLEVLSRAWQWPGRQVIATIDSPYALLSANREAEQISFFANNLWQFTYPDPLTAEHQVQLGLLEHPHPRRVLLLGGGVAGLGAEILKTPSITHLDYVELDPFLVNLAQDIIPGVVNPNLDPRVHLIYQDARRFLAITKNRYDVILMALPEPKSAQLNRFYTREFFRTVSQKLAPGGVFSFALPGTETSLHPLRAAYLAMAYKTLGQVFPDVVAFPGGQTRFFASPSPNSLATDPQVLVQRLQDRHLNLQYVREYYLLQDLSPWRRQYLNQILRQQPVEINTDLTPRCYFYDLVLSTVQEDLGVKEVFLALQKLPALVPWTALVLATMLAGIGVRRRPGVHVLYQVVVMGLGTMALEILVLILYQIRLGSLYQELGVLVAAFMAGMAAGSALGSRWSARYEPGPRLLAGLQGGLAVLAAGLALWLQWGGSPVASTWGFWTQSGYGLILFAAGLGGGGVFAVSATLWAAIAPDVCGQGGKLYAADLLGATLGTLGVSLLVLPVWGIVPTLCLVAFLHAGAGVMALLPRDL
ncbi:MAG: fused MFS/spermidine synthase [Thermodesulfobacteriota bacterium]